MSLRLRAGTIRQKLKSARSRLSLDFESITHPSRPPSSRDSKLSDGALDSVTGTAEGSGTNSVSHEEITHATSDDSIDQDHHSGVDGHTSRNGQVSRPVIDGDIDSKTNGESVEIENQKTKTSKSKPPKTKNRKDKTPKLSRTIANVEAKRPDEANTEDRSSSVNYLNDVSIESPALNPNEQYPENEEHESRIDEVEKPASTATPASDAVGHKSIFRAWPDEELQLQRQVIEKYEAGEKLWTKEDLVAIERQITEENPVKIPAFVGDSEVYEKQKGVTYRVEFYGYQALAFPPPSRPNGMPYCTMSLRALPFDYSLSRVLALEMEIFHKCMAIWLVSPIGELLYSLFMKVPLPPHINKIVCFDLGSITAKPAEEYPAMRQAIYKHSAVLTIVECLHKRFGTMIQLFAQDTTYCDHCTKVLFQKGFSVIGLHGASGFTVIDENTLVFAPGPTFCVKEVIADIAKPAAMFWNTVLSPEETERETRSKRPLDLEDRLATYYHREKADPDTPRVREFVKQYDCHQFPWNNLFGPVSLYTRSGVSVSHDSGDES
ncbi:uncharacterized protein F4822DRAFT_445708 [Hypoxylon trugodes]|uniref:uncharacterized protein n=1 Tax=Hypoxylon trugodes TaxID=326681 RepID=UPI0021A00004|nr:uncharacterized protein F4822DRAFT_445708 [Hypoxylon trugodes]KAI1385824.1 hypothetical protein F4822DRAFT_445708 [Hypoxylon trugodes]